MLGLTSSTSRRRSEQRQSPSSHHPLSKTWGPSSKVDTRMPKKKQRQHYHYLSLQNKRVLCSNHSVCLRRIADHTAQKGVAAHTQHSSSQPGHNEWHDFWRKICLWDKPVWRPQVKTSKEFPILLHIHVNADFLKSFIEPRVVCLLTFAILPIS